MNEYLSLRDLGKLYGVSSHEVGKWLKNLGLRNETGYPTTEAIKDGLVKKAPSKQPGTYFWVWNTSKTTEILDNMCYPRDSNDEAETHDFPEGMTIHFGAKRSPAKSERDQTTKQINE